MMIEMGDAMDTEIQRILEERARALAQTVERSAEEGERLELLAFSLGDETYGIMISSVALTQPLEETMLSILPGTPDFITGVTNIRGRIYSVMDIGCYFGLPPRPITAETHILLVHSRSLHKEKMEIALLADKLPQVVSIEVSDVRPSTDIVSSKAQEYVQGVTSERLVLLDLERFLADPGIVINDDVL